MKQRSFWHTGAIIVLILALAACGNVAAPPTALPTAALPVQRTTTVEPPAVSPTAGATASPEATTQPPIPPRTATGGVEVITGEFAYTNDIITVYYVEHAVGLVDLYGFITRNEEWELPVESQALGPLTIDTAKRRGRFRLALPARPAGVLADVDNDTQRDTGVQVFVVAYWPNLYGGPFSEGDDRSFGWPSYLASTVNDPENNDEITGGKLIVWAPDDAQQFPTDFGADGLLFTADDPVGPLPAGYSVIDLDKRPFAIERDREVRMTLYEPPDAAIKDFSDLSYTRAFDEMFKRVRVEYAFNGIPGKAPDWDVLYAELAPRVAEAERRQDQRAFFEVMLDFANAFRDGHVDVSSPLSGSLFRERTASGYGFAIRELDDGRALVVFVTRNGPADRAGMQVGAEVLAFNGKPIKDAISEVEPLGGPFSTDFARRYQQARYLLRAPIGTAARVTFANPRSAPQTITLRAVEERESFLATSIFKERDLAALPVEFEQRPSGVGYIRINDNYDDLNLLIRLFERALKTFEDLDVPGIIIDMRQNSGGAPLGLAGFLTDQEIIIGQDEYYSERTGKFEPDGPVDKILPNQNQYRFDKIVLLVGQACFSACEFEAYGFSKVPGVIVVGETPTAGVYAEVSRGQYLLPDDIFLQIPTGRTVLPDGTPLLEGVGVVPTIRVPVTAETVLSNRDVVLERAEQEIVGR
ncbi:MAG: S41 family peptidase [Roseiflexus sp.]|nr:S41 family peptidase [Roseiflexus sp.]MDW8231590.1 S41 family peptidase [Roseiflexaceae bacterium]